MSFPTKITLGFDPQKDNIESFNTRLGAILWTVWKYNHITNQCFDKEVSILAEYITNKDPQTFDDFVSAYDEARKTDAFSHVEYPSIQDHCHSWMATEDDKRVFKEWLKNIFLCWKGKLSLVISIECDDVYVWNILDTIR